VRVERSSEEVRTYCKCQPGHIAYNGQCIQKLPTVEPSFFTSPEHATFIQSELTRLRSRRERLEKELEKLESLSEKEDAYLQEMGEMREQVVFDGVGDVLSLAGSKEFLAEVPKLSAADAEGLSQATKLMNTAVDSLAAAESGQDRERQREKSIDAAGGSLALLARSVAPAAQKEAISKLMEISAESLKFTAAWKNGEGRLSVEGVAKTMDQLAEIAGAIYEPLGVARASVQASGAGIVLWHIQTDKQAIVEALVSAQRAKLAADQRLAATQEMIHFYETELKKTGN
jgi:hypothetical protein